MTNETPKLLTEAEWRELWFMTGRDEIIEKLRERGLITPEPVDPLLVEAREIAARYTAHPYDARQMLEGNRDDWESVKSALAALKRGMELARPTLTREQVREAVEAALQPCVRMLAYSDFRDGAFADYKRNVDGFLTRLHAALTNTNGETQ